MDTEKLRRLQNTQIADSLLDNLQILPLIMNNIPQAVFWKDQNLVYLGCNQAFAEDAGMDSPDQIVGKTDYDMPWTAQAELYRADDAQVMESGFAKINYEEPQTNPQGKITWLRTSKIPIRDEAGNIIAVLGMYEDITQHKQAEQTLRESEERFRTLFEQSADAYLIIDEGRFVDCNQATVKMLRAHNKEEVLNTHPSELSPSKQPDGRPSGEKADEMMQIALKQGSNRFEWTHRKMNGDDFPAEVLLTPIPVAGKTVIHTVWRDISNRKRLEKETQLAFEKRGYQVQISTEIAQELAKAAELSGLFAQVVKLTKERLGYYHTQLLQYDPAQDAVILISGYGETGQQMLAQGHRLPMGTGLIGTAAARGETVLRPNLAADPDWRPNPLLPETRGEVAVPIKLGDQVLGVLDVQSNLADALTEDDQLLLEGLCGQIAIAMEQTRLRQEMSERLEEINRLYRAMSREGWETYQTTTALPEGFQFDQAGIRALTDKSEAHAVVATPLTVPGGHAIGTLEISDDPDNPLSPEDRVFLEQVSEQVALALESARLFEQTQAALAAVQESEAQLSEALEIAKLGYWEYDFANDEFILTDNFYSIFHTSAEKMGGYRMSSADYSEKFVHPEDAALVGTEIERTLATTDRFFSTRLEHRILYQDGGEGYISVNINLERDENGNIIRWYGANQDITERRQAEEAVRQAQERAQTILETVTIPMVITRLSDNIMTFANQPAAELVSVPLEALIDSPAPDFYVDLDQRAEFIGELREQGFVNNMQVQLRRGNQSVVSTLFSARVFTYQGEPSILTTITDISDRIEAQEAAVKRAAELATVADLGTTISTILEERQLLETVAQLTRERFNLYHCHIFLSDERNQTLQVKACGWEAESPHSGTTENTLIHTDQGQSLVAQAARDQKAVIVNDVHQDSNWLPNELLPDTRSEMAIPLVAGNQVLGVLDVQANETNRFTNEDISIMTTLASQVAVALQNARTYALTQQQADQEAMINLISQRIQSTTSVESALQVAIRELGRALGAKRTNVQLGLPTQKNDKVS